MEKELLVAIDQVERRELQSSLYSIEELVLRNPKEFAATQDSFALNVAGRLVHQLAEVLRPETDTAICIALLRVLRGVCLLHRPSRHLFNNSGTLQTVITAGIRHAEPSVQIVSIDLLVAALVRHVEAIRLFEQLNGPKAVCDVFKQSRTSTPVKLAILQFLFFYLVPETQHKSSRQSPPRLTTQDKQAILGKYLSNVDGLVRELEMSKPFGSEPIEW